MCRFTAGGQVTTTFKQHEYQVSAFWSIRYPLVGATLGDIAIRIAHFPIRVMPRS